MISIRYLSIVCIVVFYIVCPHKAGAVSVYSKPTVDLSLDRNGLSVLGMSTNERLPLKWWHWLMHSRYNESSLSNHTGGLHSHYFDHSICPLRFYGVYNNSALKGFDWGGLGAIRDVTEPSEPSTAPGTEEDSESIKPFFKHILPCYYTTSISSYVGLAEPYTRIAIHCPILGSDVTDDGFKLFYPAVGTHERAVKELENGVEGGHERCRLLNTKGRAYKLNIFPSTTEPRNLFAPGPPSGSSTGSSSRSSMASTVDTSSTLAYPYRRYIADQALLSTGVFSTHAPWDAASRHGEVPPSPDPPASTGATETTRATTTLSVKSLGIACVILTFHNPVSGPNLYLFVKHHSNLGLTVLIYDRFGSHREYLTELLAEEWRGIIYNPYTALELLSPTVYNNAYAAKEGVRFKYYYQRDKMFDANNTTTEVADDVITQDADKMITFDIARVSYQTPYTLAFLDSDELIAPINTVRNDHSKLESIDGLADFMPAPDAREGLPDLAALPPVTKTQTRMTTSDFKNVVKQFFNNNLVKEKTEEVHFIRFAPSAFTPTRKVHVFDHNKDGDVVGVVNNCTARGYAKRDIAYMMSCWSDAMVQQKWLKFADNSAVCPFHWIHRACWKHSYFPKNPEEITPEHILNRNGGNAAGCFCGHKWVFVQNTMVLIHLSHHQYLEQHKYWRHFQNDTKFQHGVNPLVDLLIRP